MPAFQLKELFYVPNLIGYVRLALVVYALAEDLDPLTFLAVMLISFVLDLFDGALARLLNQCSFLGAILDIVCDNSGRSVMWVYASAARPEFAWLAKLEIALEWSTLAATQTKSYLEGTRHWKKQTDPEVPWLIREFFRNNFVNPVGVTGILALFGLPVHIYVEKTIPWIADMAGPVPWFCGFVYLLAGRLMTNCIEVYLIVDFIKFVRAKDVKAQ